MKLTISVKAILIGCIATAIDLITFIVNHYMWDIVKGPFLLYQVILYPGNLTLLHFWFPIFTAEVNFWPKLLMLLSGQFVVVTGFSYGSLRVFLRIKARLDKTVRST